MGTQSPANYFDSRLASPLASETDIFEKMELNFLQVILSFQNEFKYKTPSQKIHSKLLLESMKTIRDTFISNSYIQQSLLWP